MTQALSLKELKALNAQESEPDEIEQPEVVEETNEFVEIEAEPEESEGELEAEESESQEEESEAESETEEPSVEEWMKSDEDDESDSGFKPDSLAASLRKKYKAKAAKKDEELEQLRAEIEQLKSKGAPVKSGERPRLEDFDYDEAKYQDALDNWYELTVESKLSAKQQEELQKRQMEAQQRKMESAISKHYEAAAKLIGTGAVSEEQYTNAEQVLRDEIERVVPGKGEMFVDSIIATLNDVGEGSEKVTFALGVNKSKREKLIQMLATNPSSPAVGVYLGQLMAQATMPAKRKSSAPKPATEVKTKGKGKAESLHQTYSKMPAGPERVKFKRKAKADGVDTSKW